MSKYIIIIVVLVLLRVYFLIVKDQIWIFNNLLYDNEKD